MSVFFYMSESGDGWKNLAIDRFFLENTCPEDIVFYFYINTSAVIIGKSQNAWRECNIDAMERDGVQLVRRHTGGGAVFHDENNLNFSFIMGEKNYDLDRQMGVVKNAMSRLGLKAERSGRNDMLIDGRKFSGNAFALLKGIYAHHGTLLVNTDMTRLAKYLNVSEKKMHSKGIKSVRSRVCNLADFDKSITVERVAELLKEEFAKEYGSYKEFAFRDADLKRIDEIYKVQSSWEWRLGRAPVFDYEIDERFSFGEVQMLFGVKDGYIADISVYSDALDTGLADEVKKRLRGTKFDAAAMSCALSKEGGSDGEFAEMSEYIKNVSL